MRFRIEEYTDPRITMRCTTKDECDIFSRYLHRRGRRWSSGHSYETLSYFRGNQIFYYFNTGTYGTVPDINNDKILSFSDFDWEDHLEDEPCEITFSFEALMNAD